MTPSICDINNNQRAGDKEFGGITSEAIKIEF
jgi:hypothetical protein